MGLTNRKRAQELYLREHPPAPPQRDPKPVEERKRARMHRQPTTTKRNTNGRLI